MDQPRFQDLKQGQKRVAGAAPRSIGDLLLYGQGGKRYAKMSQRPGGKMLDGGPARRVAEPLLVTVGTEQRLQILCCYVWFAGTNHDRALRRDRAGVVLIHHRHLPDTAGSGQDEITWLYVLARRNFRVSL